MTQKCLGVVWEHPRPIRTHFQSISTNKCKSPKQIYIYIYIYIYIINIHIKVTIKFPSGGSMACTGVARKNRRMQGRTRGCAGPTRFNEPFRVRDQEFRSGVLIIFKQHISFLMILSRKSTCWDICSFSCRFFPPRVRVICTSNQT